MAKASKISAERVNDFGEAEDRASDLHGYTINFTTIREDGDITDVLASLPEGKCTCPHWGYVLSGRIEVAYDDGTSEVIEPGDAFYLPAGHTSWRAQGGTELVQFSPADQLAAVDAAITAEMQRRMQQA